MCVCVRACVCVECVCVTNSRDHVCIPRADWSLSVQERIKGVTLFAGQEVNYSDRRVSSCSTCHGQESDRISSDVNLKNW